MPIDNRPIVPRSYGLFNLSLLHWPRGLRDGLHMLVYFEVGIPASLQEERFGWLVR